jgi:SAP domain
MASSSAPGAGMTVAELKEQCRQLGLPVSGLKAELQQRLAAHSQVPQSAPTALVGGSLLGDDDLFPSSYGQQQQQQQQHEQPAAQQPVRVAPQTAAVAPRGAAAAPAVTPQQPSAGAHTAAAPAPQQSGMQLPPNLAAAAAAAIAAYERQWAVNDDDDDDDDEYVDPADVTELLVVTVPEAAQLPAVGASDVLRAAAAVQAVPVAQPAVSTAVAEPVAEPVAESVTLAVSTAELEAVVEAVEELPLAAPEVVVAAAAADVAHPTASASLFDLLSDIEDDIAGAAPAAEPVQAVSTTAATAAVAAVEAAALPQLDLLSDTDSDNSVTAATNTASSDATTAAAGDSDTGKRVWVKRERIPDPPLAPGEFAYFATCTRGLETVLKAELESALVGASYVKTGARGCFFRGDRAVGYRALLWLRTPHRVMELVAQSEGVADKDGVYELAAGVRYAFHLTQHTAACIEVYSFLALAHYRDGGSYLRISCALRYIRLAVYA